MCHLIDVFKKQTGVTWQSFKWLCSANTVRDAIEN